MGASCSSLPTPPRNSNAHSDPEHDGWRPPDPLSPAVMSALHAAPTEDLLFAQPRTSAGCLFEGGVLTVRQACILELSLSQAYRGRQWTRLFLLSQHGASLSTLLRRTRGVAPTLLCLRTDMGDTLGAFSPSPWWDAGAPLGAHLDMPPLAGPSTSFFGYGCGAFVFSFAETEGAPRGKDCTPGYKKSAWSSDRASQLQFLRVEPSKNGGGVATAIGIGGGGESFALLLDESLERGRSGRCLAFGSEGLASSSQGVGGDAEVFRALEVECWGLATLGTVCCAVSEDALPAANARSVAVSV
jgi:hypothetical protein